MHVQFSGRYRLQVFHGDTDILLNDTGWFDNLITDNGLNLLGTGYSVNVYVGSDSAEPSYSDTSITGVLASVASGSFGGSGVQVSVEPYYGWTKRVFTFAIGAVQGTIRQVAIGSSSTNLLSKARLKTVAGVETELTLGGIDRLTLTYEFRQCIDTSDVSGSIDINGTTYNYTGRPAEIDQAIYWAPYLGARVGARRLDTYNYGTLRTGSTALGTVFTNPNGTSVASTSGGTDAYVNNTYTQTMWEIWDTTKGNLTGINAFFMAVLAIGTGNDGSYGMGGAWQFLLDASFDKTQYQNFRLEWAYTWGRCE